MSSVEVCSLAYEGKFRELKEKVYMKPSLATKVDESQWTPLMIASSAGRDAIVSMLIGYGADVNSINEGGQTPLHYAASRNRYEIAEYLLQNGAAVNAQDKTSASTPLHRAASRGHSKMVKLLLKHSANCDIQDIEGNTALHMACQEERAEVAVILVGNGANLQVLNKEKLSPLEFANKGLARQLVQMSNE
ncbi:26S proteasome non-ATPase regulatory subunit 10-like isoform X2 [Montipora capricornis]|uniref:26S proteasome non-ATPase regulatory subunit 10-like isoform X2 n=1 Tax=Montipora capricornis TaxID=246305 RepID=UPI0035F1AD0C